LPPDAPANAAPLALLPPAEAKPPTPTGALSSDWLDELQAQSAPKEPANDKAISDCLDFMGLPIGPNSTRQSH
jgi:hypothetical protein